jgi:hypothetical protein
VLRHERGQFAGDLPCELVDVENIDDAVVRLHRERRQQLAARASVELARCKRGNVRHVELSRAWDALPAPFPVRLHAT